MGSKRITYHSKEALQAVQAWKRAGIALSKVRRDAIRATASTRQALLALADLFEHAVQQPLRPSSGLVEQQRLFAKLRDEQNDDFNFRASSHTKVPLYKNDT